MSKKPPPVTVHNRVRVTNQKSTYRNHLGQVIRIDADDAVYVRIDGHERNGAIPFRRKDLCLTTLESEVEYDAFQEMQALIAAADTEE